jgi:hypothetical protein
VRADPEAFLRKHLADSEHLDVILEQGSQAGYSVESRGKKANPLAMVAAGGADVAEYSASRSTWLSRPLTC